MINLNVETQHAARHSRTHVRVKEYQDLPCGCDAANIESPDLTTTCHPEPEQD